MRLERPAHCKLAFTEVSVSIQQRLVGKSLFQIRKEIEIISYVMDPYPRLNKRFSNRLLTYKNNVTRSKDIYVEYVARTVTRSFSIVNKIILRKRKFALERFGRSPTGRATRNEKQKNKNEKAHHPTNAFMIAFWTCRRFSASS